MIRVTVMVWFELEDGEPRFKTWDTHIFGDHAQMAAEQYAASSKNGSCKIFDSMDRVIGSAGFE